MARLYRIWTERPVPQPFLPMLDQVAEIAGCASTSPEEPLGALPLAEGIIVGSRFQYDGTMMDRARDLRVIARTGIGLDNVDLAAATARGVAVCYTPESPTISTAEHTVMMLLATAKHLGRVQARMRAGGTQDYFSLHTGIEVRGRVLGLVGLGRIGSEVAKMARGLGMRVMAYDPYVTADRAAELGIDRITALEEVLRAADFVSLHAPSTDETRRLINRDTLALMKKGACLINCARGSLVDEQALLEALESGHLAGAGLDVFEHEPPASDHPLLARPEVIATPHIAAATSAGKERTWRAAIAQVLQVLNGERPPNLANPEVWK